MKIKPYFQESGPLALSFFWLAIISGAGLATIYNVNFPSTSLEEIQDNNLPGLVIHSIHYWSAQFCLIFSAIHLVEKINKNHNFKTWFFALTSFLLLLFVMITGYIIKGDTHSALAHNILFSLLDRMLYLGFVIRRLITFPGNDLFSLYIYHASILTIGTLATIFVHSKKLFINYRIITISWLPLFAISLLLPPQIIGQLDSIQRAPWYFLFLQEIFHWTSRPTIIAILGMLLISIFLVLPFLKPKLKKGVKVFLISLLAINILGILLVTFTRAKQWEFNPKQAIWTEKYYYYPDKILNK